MLWVLHAQVTSGLLSREEWVAIMKGNHSEPSTRKDKNAGFEGEFNQ